jgi:hypothetical protein
LWGILVSRFRTDKAMADTLRTLADHADEHAGEMELAGDWIAGPKKEEDEQPEEDRRE